MRKRYTVFFCAASARGRSAYLLQGWAEKSFSLACFRGLFTPFFVRASLDMRIYKEVILLERTTRSRAAYERAAPSCVRLEMFKLRASKKKETPTVGGPADVMVMPWKQRFLLRAEVW